MSSSKAFSNATILVVGAIVLLVLLSACLKREAPTPEPKTPTPEQAKVSPLYELQDVKALANTLADEHSPVWSPDGSKIYFKSDSEIHVSNLDGSQREKLAELESPIVFNPDKKSVFYTKTISSEDKTTYRAYMMDLDSKNQERIAELTLEAEYADDGDSKGARKAVHDMRSWSPDRTKIFFTKLEETGYSWVWREKEEKWVRYKVGTEPSITVLPNYYYDPAGGGLDLRLIAGEYEETAWIWDLKDNELRFIGHLTYSMVSPVFGGEAVWSPDGESVALPSIELSEVGAAEQILVIDVETGERKRLTSFIGVNALPKWSPDGRKIMYLQMPPKDWRLPHLGDNAEGADIWVVDVDGSNKKQLTDTVANWEEGYWSPDGSKVVYVSWELGFLSFGDTLQIEIWRMNADGSNKRPLAKVDGFIEHMEWSPDDSKIALVRQVKPGIGSSSFHRNIYLIDVPR